MDVISKPSYPTLKLKRKVLQPNQTWLDPLRVSAYLSQLISNLTKNAPRTSHQQNNKNRTSRWETRASVVPRFDYVVIYIKQSDSSVQIYLNSLERYAPGFVAGEPIGTSGFNYALGNLRGTINFAKQLSGLAMDDIEKYLAQKEEEIQQWGASSKLLPWQPVVNEIRKFIDIYFSTAEKEWGDQITIPISVSNADPVINQLLLNQVAAQNEYEEVLELHERIIYIDNNLNVISDNIEGLGNTTSLTLLNLQLRRIRGSWDELVEFVNEINLKSYILVNRG